MFPRSKGIERSFQYIRLITLVTVIGCLLFAGFVVLISNRAVSHSQQRVYVLAAGKALEAVAADRRENIPAEARDHIRSFHQFFFSLDPDEKVIRANLARALYLADASAFRVSDNLKENGYYSSVVAGNISQEIAVDSIILDTDSYPFHFRCYATERIIRPTSIATRYLLTEGWLRNTSRSDNNPHGFLIERWTILDNHDLRVESR
ncbi:MAG: conjugative transposon protein TraK [Bacteroidetes bacterium]|nr:conjugative transposon protein TraK [Bacteroidota bacterium]